MSLLKHIFKCVCWCKYYLKCDFTTYLVCWDEILKNFSTCLTLIFPSEISVTTCMMKLKHMQKCFLARVWWAGNQLTVIRNSTVSSAFTAQNKIKRLKMPVFQFCWCSHSCCHLETGCSETLDKCIIKYMQLHIFNRLKQDAHICFMQANQLLVHAICGTTSSATSVWTD